MIPAFVHHKDGTPAGWAAHVLVCVALLGMLLLVGVPVAAVVRYAFEDGLGEWWRHVSSPDARSAIVLTLLAAAIVVPLNVLFGILAAIAVTRERFPGKGFFLTLIDLPFSISPVVAGLGIMLIFGSQGFLGPWLIERNISVVFAFPAVVLATLFVTLPFVARELIPIMSTVGTTAEESARSLGAPAIEAFLRATLPQLRLGLVHGVLLCTARALGEFGAVSVVSGYIRGETVTVPLYVEILYNEYEMVAAFAVASLLMVLAVGNLLSQVIIRTRRSTQGEPAAIVSFIR